MLEGKCLAPAPHLYTTPAKLNSHPICSVEPTRYHDRMTRSRPDRKLTSRRSLLIGGSGLLAAYAVGCGDDENPASPTASPAASTTRAPSAATSTPTLAPTPGVMRWRRIE